MDIETRSNNLLAYIATLDNVAKMKKQMNLKQAERILSLYTSEEVKETLDEMDNHVPLTRKYRSVSMTLEQWIKLKRKKQAMSVKGSSANTGLFTYDEALSHMIKKGLTPNHLDHFDPIPQPDGKKPLWRLK